MLWIISAIIISYLVGSIPTAYIFGRLIKGIDIRQAGSGNVGATNALRLLGRGVGVAVLLLDILKGFLAVTVLGMIFEGKHYLIQGQNLLVTIGLSCICGHIWSIFLRFKGGKGIATSLGVLLALALRIPGLAPIIGILVLIWLVIFSLTRLVSLASICAALALPVACFVFKQPPALVFLSITLSIFTILRHKANISRLIQGSEPRLVFGRKAHN